MVADTHKQPESSSPEDDALKRSTDCVYFLASPLTCKKGSECEYRHSEYARVNPRDCWFWLNSNCLNPKCTFRHPPLDGLLSTQVDIPVRSLIAPVKPALSAATQVNCTASKQAVPCIFFQKGMCFKGDRCAFLHGPIPISNKGPQAPTAPSVTECPSFKRSFGGLEKCTQEQKISQSSMSKPIEIPSTPKPTGVPPSLKPARKTETAPIKNGVSVLKHLPRSTAIDTEMRCVRSTVPEVVNGSSISRANHIHQSSVSNDCSFRTDKDAEERLRGSFAGFGVLVDNPDQYGRKRRGHEGQSDNAHSEDYSSTVEIDRERLHDPRTFDSYEHMQGKYAHVERRSYPKAENPDQTNESDLRRHLLKEKRVSGLRSVVTCDYGRDRHTEEQSYLPPKESSLSSRFRGRLNLSRKLSSIDGTDLRIERGRNEKPQMSSQTGRIRDRITGLVEGDFINKGKGFRASQIDRDIMDDKGFDFAAPKSLSELKEGKISQSKTQSFSSGRQRNINESEGDLLFEGPKPLSTILKRKREAELCDNNRDSNKKERVESLPHSFKAESVSAFHSQPETTMNDDFVHNDEEEINSASSELPTVNVLESDNDVRLHEMEDQELEAYDQRDGDYDDANGEYAEEYLEEDDDEDDFAKKIGIILT